MDLSLNEEQLLLQDSVDKFVRDNADIERYRQLSKTQPGFDRAIWQQFADLGWLAVPFNEAHGGLGGSAVDMFVLSESLGKGLIRSPLQATLVGGGGFLRLVANEEQQAKYIPGLVSGATQWAFAFAEESGGYDIAAVATTAQSNANGYTLKGKKIAVLNGHCADFLIVTARTAGNTRDQDGISLFIVDTRLDGITREPFVAVDGSHGATIAFDNVQVPANEMLAEKNSAFTSMAPVIDAAIVAMGGEALGAMQVLLDTTVEYSKTRKQFGQSLSKFQALQHRMADMYLRVEETRSLLYYAAIRLDEGSEDAAQACASLKVKIGEAGKYVSQQAVQLHGAVGMTDELGVSHYFKRLMLLARQYGDEDYYLRKYVELAKAG